MNEKEQSWPAPEYLERWTRKIAEIMQDILESGDERIMVQSTKPNEITNLISAIIDHEG